MTSKNKQTKLRLQGFVDEWKQTILGEVAERVTRKNTTQNDNNLTISAEHGLINQEDFFTKRIASKNNEHYYLLLKNEFAYNKSYSAGYPFGVIKKLNRYEAGAVSTLYICFRFKDKNISVDFMEQYFNACIQDREIKQIAQEGARNHGLLNIPVQDFFSIKLHLPSLHEQQAIATLFTTLDNHMNLLQRQLKAYQDYKKSMLQKLFPAKDGKRPQLRIKWFNNDWIETTLGEVAETCFSGGTPLSTEKSYYSGDIPFIRSGEINSNKTELYITENAIKESSAKMVKKGDLLIALYGATSGEIAIAKINGAINQAILCMRLKANHEFVYNYILLHKSNITSKYLQGGQGNLSGQIIKSLPIFLPTLPEQQAIATLFTILDTHIANLSTQLELYNKKKKAMLQNIFPSI